IGGTVFVGRATVRQLVEAGHDVAVLHRGTHEPDDLADVTHIHGDRNDLAPLLGDIDAFSPDVIWDNMCMFGRQAKHVVDTLGERRYVVTSSMDVYEAYGALHAGTTTQPVPVDETSPVRSKRYPYKGQIPGPFGDEYDKLDVEEIYLAVGATVLRWPMVYGPHDGQRREEYVLSRVRAGRDRIPIGHGMWLGTKGFSEDVATGCRLAIESDSVRGEIFNLGERASYAIGTWTQMILDAAGSSAELVRVPDDKLPADLAGTGGSQQHLLVSSAKAHATLGFSDTDPREALKLSVGWHLANPPHTEEPPDFAKDDEALAASP
ncbi:MAG: NAD-dependent epimerase/dehydratase family protein, partial [Actinomycetota bacterium]